MKENKPAEVKDKQQKQSAKGDIIIWVVTIAVLAVFALLMYLLGRWGGNKEYFATLTAEDGRYGDGRVASLTFANDYAVIKRDISWYVDGQHVKTESYESDKLFTLELDGFSVGSHEIEVKVDDEVIAKSDFLQQKPLLMVNLPVIKIKYGEPVGQLKATASGWVDGDEKTTQEASAFDDSVQFVHEGKLNAGTYPLDFDKSKLKKYADKYEVNVNAGRIEVLPRELVFEPYSFSKIYDGQKSVSAQSLKLSGVTEGDLVDVVATAEFCDKNVGTSKKVKLTDCKLVGKDAGNYTVNYAKAEFVGSVTPLNISIEDIKAMDKVYDGTTSVTFADGGKLSGVLSGDSVSVGVIIAKFEDAKKGTNKKVIIEKVTLVGADGGNYLVSPTFTTASIIGKASSAVQGS